MVLLRDLSTLEIKEFSWEDFPASYCFSMAPMNSSHLSKTSYLNRFSKLEMERILESINFSFIEVVKTSSGLYKFEKK